MKIFSMSSSGFWESFGPLGVYGTDFGSVSVASFRCFAQSC
jgi:hypothetical protein